MAIIKPFLAFRPQREKAAMVAAFPYDVMNTAEARDMAEGNPYSFLHISRPEIDLPADADPYSEQVYLKGRRTFNSLSGTGFWHRTRANFITSTGSGWET